MYRHVSTSIETNINAKYINSTKLYTEVSYIIHCIYYILYIMLYILYCSIYYML